MRLIHLIGAAFGAGLAFLATAGGAQAYDHRERGRDHDHWRHEHWRHDHRHESRHVHDRTVVVRERPVYVERARPVFVQPAPMYAAPMYQNPGPSGLNLNFNIPLN
jgi:hypothetical protein